ncbi:PDZ domain-containing protein [Tautonia plasticadhaerens]|uniref:Periplasmic pH-dependent serine endoprotease DegQ n=1 Tax=Tautonia plasticadhaerens TaxID=2527974 RepID=A0A518H8Z7_9BACT|nr:PDZ domain-containing protein [Tautonia plasticadhaerens]QDV37325.1 Periplasmic pH-dependent serine endoprotease DegQ precursor [Tautonia plasticadhaerens]
MRFARRLLPTTLAASLALVGLGSARPAVDPEAKVEVPFDLLPSNHMVVEVSLNGEGPYRLIFDVGSPVTLIGNSAAKESGIIDGNAPFAFLFAARGEAEVKTMQVGSLTTQDVPVIVMDHPVVKALGDILGKPIHGLVGHSFFARYKTTIDYQAETMAFEPVEHEIRDFLTDLPDRLMGPKVARRIIVEPMALIGFALEDTPEDGPRGVTIVSVLDDSPAARAGLRPGDVITSLDGRWTTSIPDTYTAASKVEPGLEIEVVIDRDGEEMKLEMTPTAGI